MDNNTTNLQIQKLIDDFDKKEKEKLEREKKEKIDKDTANTLATIELQLLSNSNRQTQTLDKILLILQEIKDKMND